MIGGVATMVTAIRMLSLETGIRWSPAPALGVGHHAGCLELVEDFDQNRLQGLELRLVGIHIGVIPGVQWPMARNRPIVASTGTHSGMMMRKNVCRSLAPSILEDSSISPGICSMKVRTRIIRNTPIKPGKM